MYYIGKKMESECAELLAQYPDDDRYIDEKDKGGRVYEKTQQQMCGIYKSTD